VEIRGFVRRLIGAIRSHWPKVEILLRADSHYAGPEVFDWCRTNRVDWVLGLAPNAALAGHVAALEKSTAARFKAAPTRGKVRRFMQFYDAAQSWRRVERTSPASRPGPRDPIPGSSLAGADVALFTMTAWSSVIYTGSSQSLRGSR
jgi:hypothetical protein